MKTNTFRIKIIVKRHLEMAIETTPAIAKAGNYHSFGRMLKKLDN
jgi:hypothetical protein